MIRNTAIALVAGLLLVLSLPSVAGIVTVNFEGTIHTVGDSVSGDGVNVGDGVSGTFSYDTAASDLDSSADRGFYFGDGFSLTLGGTHTASASSSTVRTQNDQQNGSATNPADGMTVFATPDSGFTLNGRAVEQYQFGLRRDIVTVGQLWADDLLPDLTDWNNITLADVNAPDWHWMALTFDSAEDTTTFDRQIRWDIDSFSVTESGVPEPATVALLALGLCAIAWGRRRRLVVI